MHSKLFAVMATVGLVLFALGPGVATVAAEDGSLEIEVEQAGNDGPTVTVTEELSTVNETENASFGSEVSMFVQSLLSGGEENIGPQVADFVTSNNPGNAPDHAGPPSENQTGPPENAGPPSDNETGPPADVGPGGDNETDDRRGPPADAGPSSDDTETDDGNETENPGNAGGN